MIEKMFTGMKNIKTNTNANYREGFFYAIISRHLVSEVNPSTLNCTSVH